MFEFKKFRIVMLSLFITLVVAAVAVSPALADDGDGQPALPETPLETETDAEDSALAPDLMPAPEEGTEQAIAAEAAVPDQELPASEGGTETDPAPDPGSGPPPDELEGDAEPSPAPDPGEDAGNAADSAPEADPEAVLVEIELGGDPIWCPAAVGTPLDGAAGCTASYTSLQDLISYLTANEPSVDGVIWIEKDYDSSVNDPGVPVFIFDGTVLTTMADFKLTIRGGWDGLGTKTVDPSNPSEINARLEVYDWNNDVTITDIEITGASGGYGLVAETSMKITLDRVRVAANTTGGAWLDNTAGTADVTVSNSQFNDNSGGHGLYVGSKGTITLKNVSASGNFDDGAYLNNISTGAAKNVVLTSGPYDFNDNGSEGLVIHSKGAVNLKDITAVGNDNIGSYISNISGSSAGVTLSGTNIFSENAYGGLSVYSNGAIKANNIIANANYPGPGVYLDNTTATLAKPVTFTGASEFKFNESGLVVYSLGAINLSNITASFSTFGVGGSLYNSFPGTAASVTLTGVNIFDFNSSSGLTITSNGVIGVSNLTASNNGWSGWGYGANLNNSTATSAKAVNLTGTNTFLSNSGTNLDIAASGPITVDRVTASYSEDGSGIFLDNDILGPSAPQNVSLKTYTTAEGNYSSGLVVYTYGNIIGANINANGNGAGTSSSGAFLYSSLGGAYLPRVVNLTGSNSFNGNSSTGLHVSSLGNISVFNLQANGNLGDGAFLYTNATGANGSVKVNGTSTFNYNNDSGLVIYSVRSITVQNVDAYENGSDGVYLFNAYPDTSGSVAVGTSLKDWFNDFSSNVGTGLAISSYGNVTLYNIRAQYNGDPGYALGASVFNHTAAAPRYVKLLGTNIFNGNFSGGLEVYSKGAISASSLTANDNGGVGAYLLNNANPDSPQNVTLTGVNTFFENASYGLRILSYGSIATSNLSACWNGDDGAYLDNSGAKPKPVTLNGTNWFEGNGGSGLVVLSLGAIKSGNIQALENTVAGAYLSNSFVGAVGGASVLGTSEFSYNGDSGLEIWSRGAILVQDLDAFENGNSGAYLYNAISGEAGNVTLGTTRANWCNGFMNNAAGGLDVYSNGVITLRNICATGNGYGTSYGYGAYVQNSTSTTPKAVTLQGSNSFNGNYSGGLEIYTRGPVTASDLSANGNGGIGAAVFNILDPASQQKVTITGDNEFVGNTASGLWVFSYGPIQVSSIDAWDNGEYGAVLDNWQDQPIAAKPLTLTGSSTFIGNGQCGLIGVSWGAIKGSNITSLGNADCGAYLDNQWLDGSVGGITLSGTNRFEENAMDGLVAYSHGAITISNLSASWNGYLSDGSAYSGAILDTWGLSTPQKVTLTGYNTFIGNGDFGLNQGNGLEITADGSITISNLTASRNAANGALLDTAEYWWSGTPGITLTGTNNFNQNFIDGLWFQAAGPVSLSKISADANAGSGVYGTADDNITIKSGSMNFNGEYGWYLWCSDVALLQGVFAYGNSTNTYFDGPGTLIIKRY